MEPQTLRILAIGILNAQLCENLPKQRIFITVRDPFILMRGINLLNMYANTFNIKSTDENLQKFEKILNDFSAAEQGKQLLRNERDEIVASISKKVPLLIRAFNKKRLIRKLGFDDIDFGELYFPRYTFCYISSSDNSSMRADIVLNIENLNRFVNYLASSVKFKKSIAAQ